MTEPPLIIEGDEQSKLDPNLPDGGLPPVVGVQSFQVFRASRDVPEMSDRKGWTYHHHVDMASWRGRLYVGWNSCERDEDVWPSRELYSTSTDGRAWADPAELFPQGVSTALRMYFFRASSDRMLAIAGMRTGIHDTSEDRKWPLVVREIRADHTLGDVFALQGDGKLPPFERSPDTGFVAACHELLADTVFLEQQDRGKLLGERRMKWHDASAWPAGAVPGDSEKWVAGKAYSFFRRRDGAFVGVSKMGWTTISRDDGKTWSQPLVPPTLITGKAKVWSQQTRDGRFALVYNPSRKNRFPLAIVTSDDGITLRDMRIVQGELPVQRYEGKFRSIGPQYTRGISHWADDGSRSGENAMWLVYSMSKEDIWVSRVPLSVKADARGDTGEWNIYSPKWAPVTIDVGGDVTLEDRDPWDYASATRIFGESKNVTISFDITTERTNADVPDTLEIDLRPKFGNVRPIRLRLARAAAGERHSYTIRADATAGRYTVTRDGNVVTPNATFVEPCETLHRITFRTGGYRTIGGSHPVPAGSDRPHEPVRFRITAFRVTTA